MWLPHHDGGSGPGPRPELGAQLKKNAAGAKAPAVFLQYGRPYWAVAIEEARGGEDFAGRRIAGSTAERRKAGEGNHQKEQRC